MRNAKFRGKRIDNNEWVYGHYFVSPLTDENSGTTSDKGWFFLSGEKRHCIEQNHVVFVVDPDTVSQSTGCYDKNRKEIYDGDDVMVSHRIEKLCGIGKIYWSEEGLYWACRTKLPFLMHTAEQYEVLETARHEAERKSEELANNGI